MRELSESHASQEGATVPDYSWAKVLVVDDNPTIRLLATKLLSMMGVTAEALTDGIEAVEAAKAKRYDLIFMDYMMTEMDGIEATRAIRESSESAQNHKTPIVALTARAMDGDREACLAAGMVDYIVKPINPEELKVLLARWLAPEETLEEPDAEADGEPKLFDLSHLAELFGGTIPDLDSLIEAFVRSLNKETASIAEVVGSDYDLKKLRLHVHSIKGASANFGSMPLHLVAAELEKACLSDDREKAEAMLPDLLDLVERTIAEAEKELS